MRIEIHTKIDFIEKELSVTDVIIYNIIKKYCEYGVCNVSNNSIALELNITFPTVKKSLTLLKEKGYIQIENISKNKRSITLCQKFKKL